MVNLALERAIELAGNQAELARRASVSVQRIHAARKRGSVSKKLAEKIAGGLADIVTKESLVFGSRSVDEEQ